MGQRVPPPPPPPRFRAGIYCDAPISTATPVSYDLPEEYRFYRGVRYVDDVYVPDGYRAPEIITPRCEYCGQTNNGDARGGCLACGAPLQER